MDKPKVSIDELRRRVEVADSETLQLLYAMFREEARRQRRAFSATLLTTTIGLASIVYSILPNAHIIWVGIACLAFAAAMGYMRMYRLRSLEIDRILQFLNQPRESHLGPEDVQRLRSEIVHDLFGRKPL